MAPRILPSGWLVALCCGLYFTAWTAPEYNKPHSFTNPDLAHLGTPVFEAPPPDDVTVNCVNDMPAPVDLPANDGMGGATFMVSPMDAPDPASIDPCVGGLVSRTWSAIIGMDTTTVEQLITILPDNTGPVVMMDTSPDTVACELAQLSAPNNPFRFDTWLSSTFVAVSTNASDDCSGVDDVIGVPPAYAGDCNTMTYPITVLDNCGNTTQLNFSLVTIDTVGPQFMGVPPNDTLSCEEPIPAPPMVTVTDNCTPDMVATFTEASGQVMDGTCGEYQYNILRTWLAQDSCGNSNSYTQIIRIIDQTPPAYTVPPDVTISCNSDPNDLMITGDVTDAMDNCSPDVQVFFTDEVDDGDCVDEYTVTRTWRAIDACGNVSGKIQEITVADLQGPSFNAPVNITVDCNGADDLAVTGEPTNLMDDCDPAPAITFTDVVVPGSCPNNSVITRFWRATDRCGNFTEKIQTITVEDEAVPTFSQQPQDLILNCTADLDVEAAFNDWVANRAGAVATDNCTLEEDLEWFVYNTGTTDAPSLPLLNCPADTSIILAQAIDVIVRDECANSDTLTVSFQVLDQTPPVLTECPDDLTVATDPGLCSATVSLVAPLIEDVCALDSLSVNLSDTQTVTSQAPPGEEGETPVDPVTLSMPVGVPLPVNAAGEGTLTISLFSADAEAADEYFLIYGENGTLIGQTAPTPDPCSDSQATFTIPVALLNSWSADGVIDILLEPFIPADLPGRFAINAICDPATTVQADLSFPVKVQGEVVYEYSINNGSRIVVDPIMAVDVSLDQGNHLIRYFATDCAGNSDSCSYTVMVVDQEAPELICPADMLEALAADSCTKTLTLPLPLNATDNCGIFNSYQRTLPETPEESLLQFNLDPNLNDYLALGKTLQFDDVAANAYGDATLTLVMQGDFNTNGAFVDILGDDGSSLGFTNTGIADCASSGQFVINIPSATFNAWAADGTVSIEIVPNDITVPPGVPGDGINPCGTGDPVTNNGDTDGISFINATLTYSNIAPQYYTEGATTTPLTSVMAPAIQPELTFNQGDTEVFYLTNDLAGNADTCSFMVTVEDTTPPTALCQPTNLFINPSGLQVEVVDASDADAGSFDNCAIDSIWLLPNVFTCAQIGQTVNVTLSVRDEAGNIGTCNTIVGIAPERPMPTANSGLCGGDTLFLFANPPPPNPEVYSFEWYDPDDVLISTDQNPTIPNIDADDEGPYRVVVTGLSGCTSEGVVFVDIEGLPLTPELEGPPSVCVDENILLETAFVPSGNSVTFYWYAGLPPSGSLMDSTTVPQYTVAAPHNLGANSFYLQVAANGCISPPSAAIEVITYNQPTATVAFTDTLVCEGEVINLGVVSQANAAYQWVGPNTFVSTEQFPEIGPLGEVDGGYYYVRVNRGECYSTIDSVLVTIKPQPAQPTIMNSGPVCEGESLTLSTTTNNASFYHWKAPNGITVTTTIPSYTVPVAGISSQGAWTLTVTSNGCDSPVSLPTNVTINPANVASASISPMMACEGDEVTLQAFASVPGSAFQWEGPDDFSPTVSSPMISNVSTDHAGEYRVTVTSPAGCADSASVSLSILDGVEIIGLSDNVPACIQEGFDVAISSSTFPMDDGSYSYRWFRNGMQISTSSVLNIPNASAADEGAYSLEVETAAGCTSEPETITLTLNFAPEQPAAPSTVSGETSFCEGETFFLTTTAISSSNIQYYWLTPAGTQITTSNMLEIMDANPIGDSGDYRVYVVRDGCPSTVSPPRPITVNPIPAITATSNSPVCQGDVISLQATFYPEGQYVWNGPITSGAFNPMINNASADLHAGTYSVFVTRFGCVSDTVFTDVEVKDRPAIPVAYHEAPICLDDPDAVLLLGVDTASATAGASYTWYTNNGATPLPDPTSELIYEYIDFTDFATGGTFDFFVEAELDGCTSSLSNPTAVRFDIVPENEAFAGIDTTVCSGDFELEGVTPSLGTGRWSLLNDPVPAGFSIANPDDANTTVDGLDVNEAPYFLQWTLSNGACQNYSADTVVIDVILAETAIAGDDILACDDEIVTLSAVPVGEGSSGYWTQGLGQYILGVRFVDSLNSTTEVLNLSDNNLYFFDWVVTSVCGTSVDQVIVNVSDSDVDAGPDIIVCDDLPVAELLADSVTLGSFGRWTSLTDGVVVDDLDDPRTEVSNLQLGENIFVWEVDEGFCGDASRDTVSVFYKTPPELVDDVVNVEFGESVNVLPFLNDLIPANSVLSIGEPDQGAAILVDEMTFNYVPPDNFVGEDQVEYQLLSEGCEEVFATVTFLVGEDAICQPPSIITPNNDGINDNFVVPCLLDISQFPRSEVIIINRWGDEVYRSGIPYESDWNGTYSGEDLPADTYFYIVDLGDGSEPLTGYVMIQR